MFLLVPAYPGCPGSKAVKRSLLLLLFLPFWYWLTKVVPEKGSLNVCVCACVRTCMRACVRAFRNSSNNNNDVLVVVIVLLSLLGHITRI